MTINLKNLLNPNIKISKMGDFQELKQIEGLSISAVSADLYGDGRDDSKMEQDMQHFTQNLKLFRRVFIGI